MDRLHTFDYSLFSMINIAHPMANRNRTHTPEGVWYDGMTYHALISLVWHYLSNNCWYQVWHTGMPISRYH